MSVERKQVMAYQNTETYSAALFADPLSLITQMFDGALSRIAQAKGAIDHGETATKAELISKAIRIIGGLEGCLDKEIGGDLAENLSSLYEYMILTLAQANIENDTGRLNEVSGLLREIKSAWVQIPEITNKSHPMKKNESL